MSIGSEFHDKLGQLDESSSKPPARFSSDAVPYILSTADAFVILLASVAGGVGYQVAIGNAVPNILPYCAVGLLASFIHILRMSGSNRESDCQKNEWEMQKLSSHFFNTLPCRLCPTNFLDG